jgi:hypothetical protein
MDMPKVSRAFMPVRVGAHRHREMVAELREILDEFRQSGRVDPMHARDETGVLGAAQLGVERAAEPHRP